MCYWILLWKRFRNTFYFIFRHPRRCKWLWLRNLIQLGIEIVGLWVYMEIHHVLGQKKNSLAIKIFETNSLYRSRVEKKIISFSQNIYWLNMKAKSWCELKTNCFWNWLESSEIIIISSHLVLYNLTTLHTIHHSIHHIK